MSETQAKSAKENEINKSQNTYKRKMRNYYLNPPFQLRTAVHVMSSVFITIGVINTMSFWKLAQIRKVTTFAVPGDGLQSEYMIFMIWVCLATFVGVGLFSFLVSIVLSHRVAGPIIAIERQLLALCEGQYSKRIHLRKYDELNGIAESVNKLSEVLENKNK